MDNISPDPLQVFTSVGVFFLGLVVAVFIRRYFRATFARVVSLYLWHTVLSLIYASYVVNYGGDALMYYYSSFSEDLRLAFGTLGVRFITSILTQVLGLSFIGCSLFFQFFGFVGLLGFDASLRDVTKDKSRYIRIFASLIVFLPSISFWSSGLGKDSLSFFSAGLALWAALNIKRRWWLLGVSVMAMLLVRPHMAGILGLGLAGSFILQRRVPLPQRLFFGTIAIVAAAWLVPVGLNYAGVGEDASAVEIIEYIEGRQGQNLSGGGAVNISDMSLPVQMFTYLFRPTIVEIRDVFSLAAAIDNLILLFLFVVGGWLMIKRPLPQYLLHHNRMFLWVYSSIAWIVLAMTTANLGIALRQKWMFVPMIIFLLISVIGAESSKPYSERTKSAR